MTKYYRILFALLIALSFGKVQAQSDELVNICAMGIGNATYIKDYKVTLSGSSVTPPTAKFNVIMNKGTVYKITVCNAEGSQGEAVVNLLDQGKTLGTNLKADGSFVKAVGFQCQRTGMYSIVVSFKDGKPGTAVAILSYMNM